MLNSLLMAVAALAITDPEGVVTTAPVGAAGSVLVGAEAPVAPEVPSVSTQEITPHGLSTDEQIDRWISQRAEAKAAYDDDDAGDGSGYWLERDDRKVHGEVSAAIGTGDFSAYSAAVSLPIGENGRLNLSYSQSKNGYGYGYGGHYGYGYGPGGFGPGGFGATGRGYGYGYGAPVFAPGVVYPGRPFGSPPLSADDKEPLGRRDGDRDRAPLNVAD